MADFQIMVGKASFIKAKNTHNIELIIVIIHNIHISVFGSIIILCFFVDMKIFLCWPFIWKSLISMRWAQSQGGAPIPATAWIQATLKGALQHISVWAVLPGLWGQSVIEVSCKNSDWSEWTGGNRVYWTAAMTGSRHIHCFEYINSHWVKNMSLLLKTLQTLAINILSVVNLTIIFHHATCLCIVWPRWANSPLE